MLIYISGAYRADTEEGINSNIQDARDAAIAVWESGFPNVAICPHLNTYHFEIDTDISHDEYIAGDLMILARCDAILMLQNWEKSEGARIEKKYAEDRNIPVYYYPHIPEAHPVELLREKQCESFIDIVMSMYRVHLSKNNDYSPANILGAGEIGLMTRVWDKISRLMNLMGFRIEISKSSFEKPTAPKNESVNDSVMDFTVYGVIWQIYRMGNWGR